MEDVTLKRVKAESLQAFFEGDGIYRTYRTYKIYRGVWAGGSGGEWSPSKILRILCKIVKLLLGGGGNSEFLIKFAIW